MKDKISSLLDAELIASERRQILDVLASDAELRASWERYHVIRAAVRHEIEWTVSPGFADRVADQIAVEPTVIRGRHRWVSSRTGWAARLAIAASVAVAVLFGLRTNSVGSGSVGTAGPIARVAQEPANLAMQGPDSGVALRDASFHGGSGWVTLKPQWQRRLSAFLLEHNQFAPDAGGSGLIGYVRIVGYDQAHSVAAAPVHGRQ